MQIMNKKRQVVLGVVGLFIILPSLSWAKVSYHKVLHQWTKDHAVYQREDFYASLVWAATLQSPEFLRAKSQEIAKIYDDDFSKEQEVLKEQNREFGDKITFFLSVYVYDYKVADLINPKNGWKLQAEILGKRYEPDKIKYLSKLSPLEKRLFPYSNIWSKHYMVYFPKPDGFNANGMRVKLHLRGPDSQDVLVW